MEQTESTEIQPENSTTYVSRFREHFSSAFYRLAGKVVLTSMFRDVSFLHPKSYHQDRWDKLMERHRPLLYEIYLRLPIFRLDRAPENKN